MKIKMLVSCAGPVGSFYAGQVTTVPDDVGGRLIRAEYAELVEEPAAATEPEAPIEPEAGAEPEAAAED